MGREPFGELQRAAGRVRGERVDARPEHELAAVGLADVDVQGAGHDHRVQEGPDGLGHGRLQRERLDGQAHPRHRRHQRGPAGRRVEHDPGGDVPLGRAHPADPAAVGVDAGDLGVLVDVHPVGGGGPGVAPVDRVVPDDAAGRVVERAQDGVPRVRRGVQVRDQALDLVRVDDAGVDALQLVDLGPPAHGAQGRVVVRQREVPAPGEHHVVVQVGGERPVQLHGPVVEADALGGQVVRPQDGRVAARAAAADVPRLQHGDVGDPVVDGQVVGGREAVHAAADDDHVVGVPHRPVRPGPRPLAARQAVAEQAQRRVFSRVAGTSAGFGTAARGAGCFHGVPPGTARLMVTGAWPA